MSHSGGIGRWQGAGLLATTLLGTGVFILPQLTLQQAQAQALWVWLLLTVLAVPLTMVFGALAGRLPDAAGPAHFVASAFGELAGRVLGLMFLLVVPLGACAALLMTWSFIEPWFGEDWRLAGQCSFLAVLYLLNRVGFQLSARLQLGLTLAIVVVVLLLLMLAGLQSAEPGQLSAASWPQPDWQASGLSGALALGFWSFLGVEAMTHLAQDFRDARRDMLPALLTGLGLVGLIYLGCCWLLLAVSPPGTVWSMTQAFTALTGTDGQWIIGVLGLCSGLATVNVYTASVARLAWRFSCQGVLPALLQPLNRYQVPERPLLLILLLMLAVILLSSQLPQPLEALIGWVNGVFLLIYLASMLAATRLLPARYQPLAWLSTLLCLGLLAVLGLQLWYGVLLIAVLTPLLWWQQRRQHVPVAES